MLEKDQLQKLGVTPGRMMLIGVLAAIFLGVVATQLLSPGEPPAPPRRGRKARAAHEQRPPVAEPPDRTAGRQPAARPRRAAEWPEMVVDVVAARDPFRPPAWAIAPPPATSDTARGADAGEETERQAASRRDRLNYLRQLNVQAILSDGDQKVAIVNGRHVRVGDVLDGFRVSEINDQGISLLEQEAR